MSEDKLNSAGVQYLWNKIKSMFALKTDVPSASIVTPGMDSVSGQVGSSLAYARADHTHPKDSTKANVASPAFTGVPTAPTAAVGTSSTQLATTAFVNSSITSNNSVELPKKQNLLEAGQNISLTNLENGHTRIDGVDLTSMWNEVYNKVDDVVLNGASIITKTTGGKNVASFNLLSGENISISRDGNTLTINGEGGGNKVYAGISTPSASIGAEDDLYLQLGVKTEDILAADRFEGLSSGSHVTSLSDFVRTARNKFSFAISGNPDSYGNGETGIFTLDGLVVGNTYHIEYDVQYNSGATFPYSGSGVIEGLTICGTIIEHPTNTSLNHVSGDFTYTSNGTARFSFWKIIDNTNFTCTITNLTITGNYYDGIDEIYGKISGKWEKYEGGETYTDFVGTDGTTDGASGLVPAPTTADVDKVLKSDGTWGDAAAVEANPSGTATDELKKIDIDGTIYDINKSYLIRNAFIYSTDELQVGVWADGKPIYQKTWALSTPLRVGSDWTNTAIDSTDIDRLIECLTFHSDGTCYDEISADPTRNSHSLVGLRAPSNGLNISYITLQYTKISDAAGSGGYQAWGFSPIIYSTEEREVGVWIDNKPLYQKTILAQTSTTSNSIEVLHNISNLGEVVHHETNFRFKTNDYDQRRFIPQFYYDMSSTYSATLYYVDSSKIYLYYGDWLKSMTSGAQTLKITLWYTKDSDTAGSGSYNTLGVPTVHYSTDEQVIGTWIDGKPIYQKTVYVANPTISTNLVSIPNAISPNVDTTVEMVGTIDRDLASYGMTGCISYDINNTEASNVYNYVRYDKYNDTLMYKCKFDTNVAKNLIVTIKYTKTTD